MQEAMYYQFVEICRHFFSRLVRNLEKVAYFLVYMTENTCTLNPGLDISDIDTIYIQNICAYTEVQKHAPV